MAYSLDQLKVFVAVVKAGSFTAAAQTLGKTQSTVSNAIANLEIDLNVQLFDRSSKHARLTHWGEKILLEAQEVLDRSWALEGLANSLSAGVEAEVAIVSELPAETLLAPLQAFSGQFPHVALHLGQAQGEEAITRMMEGKAQLAVLFSRPSLPLGLAFQQLGKLILTHVASPEHPLAKLPVVRFADLHRHRRLAFGHAENLLPSEEYLGSNLCWHAESDLALLEMARAGLGWATLPRRLIQRELQRGELVELKLAAYPHTDWLLSVDLVWNTRSALGQAASWLKQELCNHKIRETDQAGNATTL